MKKIIVISALILNVFFAFSQTAYQYDNLNRLSKVTYSNGTTIDYLYDELGNRMKKTVVSNNIAVTGVSLDKTAITLSVNSTEQLTATVDPHNATNKSISWSSSKPYIAIVNDGWVTGISVGTTTITVTTADGNKTADCEVTVQSSPNGMEDNLKTDISAYPNPFKGMLHITGAEGHTLTVLTVVGETVHIQKVTSTDETIALEHLPTGLYLFRLEKDKKTRTMKMVKSE
jgi:uncharacterized protein YjdB